MPERQRLGVKTAAEYIGMSEWTLRKWAYSGKVASIKISTRLLFEKSELDRIIAEGTRPRIASAAA